ncbi:hypothetical protein D3C84_477860 [compost metagenome]
MLLGPRQDVLGTSGDVWLSACIEEGLVHMATMLLTDTVDPGDGLSALIIAERAVGEDLSASHNQRHRSGQRLEGRYQWVGIWIGLELFDDTGEVLVRLTVDQQRFVPGSLEQYVQLLDHFHVAGEDHRLAGGVVNDDVERHVRQHVDVALDAQTTQYLRQCFAHDLEVHVLDDCTHVEERLAVRVRQRWHDLFEFVAVAEHHHVFHRDRVVTLTDGSDIVTILRERLALLRRLQLALVHVHATIVQAFVFLHAVLVVLQTSVHECGHLLPDRSQGVLRTVLQRDLDFMVIDTWGLDLRLDHLKGNDTNAVGQNLQSLLGFFTEDLTERPFYFIAEVTAHCLEQRDGFRTHGLERSARCVDHTEGFQPMADLNQELSTGRLFVEVVGFINCHEHLTEGVLVGFHERIELLHVVVVNDIVFFA